MSVGAACFAAWWPALFPCSDVSHIVKPIKTNSVRRPTRWRSLRLTSPPTLSWPGVKKIRQRWQLGTRLGTWLVGRIVLDLRLLPAADDKPD
jgi:hypothetical protein